MSIAAALLSGRSAKRACLRLRLLLSILVFVSFPRTSFAADGEEGTTFGWDRTRSVLMPAWRLAMAFHRTAVPATLTLCKPRGRSCIEEGTVPSGSGGAVHANTLELGSDLLGFGPIRAGFELSIGAGTGPSGPFGTMARTGVWARGGANLLFGVRVRDRHWLGYAELLPGLSLVSSAVAEGPGADVRGVQVTALALGGRVGASLIITNAFSAGLFAGGAIGELPDLHAGIRLELRSDRF